MGKNQKILGLLIFTLVCLFLLYEMGLQVSPSVMTEHLMHDFKVNATALSLLSSSYFYSYTLMQIPVGLLFDRLSAKGLIATALFLCSVGAFFFALTHQMLWAALGRFFMGMGSAFAFVGVLVMASRWFAQKYFPVLVGIAQFLAAIGALGGELPLAALLEKWPWRQVMIAFGLMGSLLAFLCLLVVKNPPHLESPFLLKKWAFLTQIKTVAKSAQTWWLALYAFCSWGPAISFAALWGVPYLKTRFAILTTEAASLMAFFWIGVALCSPLIGWASKKRGTCRHLMMGCSLIGAISSAILFYVSELTLSFSSLLLFGIGVGGSGQILSFALVKDKNRLESTGTAMGINNMAVVAGGALFQPLMGVFLDLFWHGQRDGAGVPVYALLNYQFAFIVLPLCFLVALIVTRLCIQELSSSSQCKNRF